LTLFKKSKISAKVLLIFTFHQFKNDFDRARLAKTTAAEHFFCRAATRQHQTWIRVQVKSANESEGAI
jgi:hypothetical protein